MNRITVILLLGCALLTVHLSHAQQDGEAEEATVEVGLAKYWVGRARQHRAIKQHQAIQRRRRNARRSKSIPPWIKYKAAENAENAEAAEGEVPAEGGEESTDGESAEVPDANGQKTLTLEDLQLWSSIDLDKNGRLTIAEFDRFVRNPSSRAFVNQMKSEKAVKAWADRVGIDVAKAKQAMAMGARANARRGRLAQLNRIRRRQLMQQQAVQRQRAFQNRNNNYFANIGRRYYRAMSRSRRDEL